MTEPERYDIETGYYHYVTEDVPKAARKCELRKSTYPRDPIPYNRLSSIAESVGDYETAVTEAREALRLEPMSVYFSNLASFLVYANRLDEAQQTVQQAFAHKIDSAWPHLLLHWIAYLRSDATAMQREADWARGKPDESQFLDAQGSIAAIRGRMREALTLVERVNERETSTEAAATSRARHALTMAMVGDAKDALTLADSVVSVSATWRTGLMTYAVGGDQPRVESLLARFAGAPPVGFRSADVAPFTALVNGVLQVKRGKAEEALQALRTLGPNIAWPLAHVGLARAYAASGNAAASRTAYEDFFALWKNADPDVPILVEARKEYALLK